MDPRTRASARVGRQGAHFEAFVFATIIFNVAYEQPRLSSAGRARGIIGDPRMIGLSLDGRC